MKSILATLPVALVCVFAFACAHESPPAGTTTTTAGRAAAQPVSQDHIDTLAKTLCDRDQGCSNIGAGRKYATRDVCLMENKADGQNELTNEHCPFGIDKYAYDRCLADIRGDKCDNVIDHFTRLNSCARASLCPR